MKVKTMNCNEIKRKLALLVGADLEESQVAGVQRHLAECPDCRETHRQLDRSHASLQAVRETPEVTLGKSLWSRVSAQLPQTNTRLSERTYLGWLPAATLTAACLALLIFAGSTPLFEAQNQPITITDQTFDILRDLPANTPDSQPALRNVSHGQQWLADPFERQDEFAWPLQQGTSSIPLFRRHDDM